VEVTVLKEGRGGVFGLGAEEARIRVDPLVVLPEADDDITDIAEGVLKRLIEAMGVSATVRVHNQTASELEGTAPTPIAFDVMCDDVGILIGRRGQTLACLQHIVRLIVSHQTRSALPIVIDVDGYKERRCESLRALAQRMAEQVSLKRAPFTLEPMPAYERRVVHLALSDNPDVTTRSIGLGDERRVVIEPK